MIDKIKMRKIRYDVVKQLELEDLLNKINTALDNKEKYKEDFDYLKDLQKEANLDISKLNYEEIINQLETFVKDSNTIDSIDHLPILDYIDEVFQQVDEDNFVLSEDKLAEFENFLLQLLQIEKLQVRMLEQAQQIFYIGDNNDIYDVSTDKVVIKAKDILKEFNSDNEEDISQLSIQYIAKLIVSSQRKYIMGLDFSDEGFYTTLEGDDIFTEEEKKFIIEESNLERNKILGQDLEEDNNNIEENDIFDDVTID